MSHVKEFQKFLDTSVSAYHAADNLCNMLDGAGYTRLYEHEPWQLEIGGKYYMTRGGTTVIAFRVPEGGFGNYLLYAAHTDSPCLKIKEAPETRAATRCTTWPSGSAPP